MVLLDTNVFLYAWGRDHPARAGCRATLRRVAAGELEATTNVEVLQEVVYVLGRRGLKAEATASVRRILELFPDTLAVTPREIRAMCELLDEVPGLSSRDALHAATVRTYALAGIMSVDRHFDRVPDLRRIDPTGP